MTEYSFQDRISRGTEAKRQRAMSRSVVPTSIYNNEEKIIRQVTIGSRGISLDTIPSSGKILPIKILGSPNAVFTATVTDSSGCSILTKEINNVKIGNKGVYDLTIKIPSINSVKNSKGKIPSEEYTINISPSADTFFDRRLNLATNTYTNVLTQRAKSKITIDKYIGNTSGLTFTSTAVSRTNETNQGYSYQTNTDISFPIAVKYTSYSSGNIYVKNTDFKDSIIKSSTIKGIVYRDGETGATNTYYFGVLPTSNEANTDGKIIEYSGKNWEELVKTTINVGSRASFKITKEKFVVSSLDENDNVIDFNKCKNKATKRFKISNTIGIVEGMLVSAFGVKSTVINISSCKTKITIKDELIIKPNTVLTFTYKASSFVSTSFFDTSKSKLKVVFNSKLDIPEQTEVVFNDDDSIVKGTIRQVGSGNTGNGDANDVDLTCTISIKKFSKKPELTYFLDMSKIISVKPNAYDQSVVTAKNTAILINMIKFDSDTNASSKTGSVVRPPSNGALSSYVTSSDSFLYTPNNNFTGSDSFTFTMSDGTNTSDEKTVLIEVLEGDSGTSDALA
jgi:hypothetical protein